MTEDLIYFIGYEENDQVVKIPLELCSFYQKFDSIPNLDSLQRIDAFTQTFTEEDFLNFLLSKGLIKSPNEIKLYMSDPGLQTITEVRGGIAFKSSLPFFKVEEIEQYFKGNITEPTFLIAATTFLNRYFSDGNHPLYLDYFNLEHYLDFLNYSKSEVKLSRREKATRDASDRQHKGECNASIKKLIACVLYGYGNLPEYVDLDYKGFHDLAMFVCLFEKEHNLNKTAESQVNLYPHPTFQRSNSYASSDERGDVPTLFGK